MRKPGSKNSVRRRGRKRARRGANRAVETALAALAHDVRTPLTGILALAELLAASDLGARERGWAMGVKDAALHLAQLTTIVCDAVRAQAVGLVLQREVFSPRRLAEAVGASLSARAQTNGLRAEIVIAADTTVLLDGEMLNKPADADEIYGALMATDHDKAEVPENPMSADRVRWEHIQRIYELCGRNVSETARRLNMHRRTLQRILGKRAPK